MGKGKYVLGAVVAAAAGYVAGILTAPKSGKETRQDIHAAAIKAKTATEKELHILRHDLDMLVAKIKVQYSDKKEEVTLEIQKAVTKAKAASEKSAEVLEAFRQGKTDDKELQKAVDDSREAFTHLKKYLSHHNA
jgi:gas vesicle protein